ncbi:MAG: glycosyltransferase family 2 protein [Prevotellaceae bacterium]|nr:glycosyltransferase family 2 protein [Prevotellaceae bacterium]
MKELAIVILNWNGSSMMRKYLPSILKHSGEAEIIVADNASTDNSLTILKEEFPTVRTIALEKNWGFAEGYNKALKQIEAKYYLLMNSDVRVEEGWLEPMVRYMRNNPDVAACQPKLLSDLHPSNFEYAGGCGGFIDKFGYPYCRGRVFNSIEKDHGQYDTVMETLWATGACLMIRSTDYWNAGGLDGRFFAHNEEIDLCWRLNIMGRRIVCVPQSRAYHLGGGTLPKGNPRKTYLNFRNNLTMLYKNLPEEDLHHIMRWRRFLDYLAAIQMLATGNIGDFKAVIRARQDFKKWIHEFDKDRNNIQAMRQTEHIVGRTGFSLLWQYYIKGRKTFRTLPKY